MKERSPKQIVHLDLDVKGWIASPPTVERARPARCPRCGAAGCPLGGALGLWGHGTRSRQVRGPLAAGERGGLATIEARRYRCRRCDATITVVPRGVAPRRHFAAMAIGLALLLVGTAGAALIEVRRRVSPWSASFDADSWVTVRRWLLAIDQGRLFPSVRPSPLAASLRQRAERAAMTLVAMAPFTAEVPEAAVMAGAARAA